jgi:hypothetical protein
MAPPPQQEWVEGEVVVSKPNRRVCNLPIKKKKKKRSSKQTKNKTKKKNLNCIYGLFVLPN